MRTLRLSTYKKKLIAKGLAENTRKQYLSCMGVLRQKGIMEDTPSAVIYEKISAIEGKPSTRRMYLKALTEYERSVIGKTGAMLKGADRVRAYQENQEDDSGIEPIKSLKAYKQIIARCDNKKIQIALRLQLESGLRAGEVAALTPADITMREGHIWLYVAPQKTPYERRVKVYDNPTLYKDLKQFIIEGGKFPSEKTVEKWLSLKGGRTHDLRRYNLRRRYTETRNNGMKKGDALRAVAKQAGHSDLNNTIRYLGVVYANDKKVKKKKT